MRKNIAVLVVVILLTGAVIAQAQVSITYSSAGRDYYSMVIPDEWQVNVGSEIDLNQNPEGKKSPARLISAMPNSGEPLWFGMWVPADVQKIDGAEDYVASLGLDLLSNAVVTESRQATLNSMEVRYVSGNGDRDGEEMDFKAGFFQLSPTHVAIAIYIGPPETTILHGDDLTAMINSLQSLVK